MVHIASNQSRMTEVYEVPKECTGYTLCDPGGGGSGARKLFVNSYGEPDYVMVKSGLFEPKDILIPVMSIAVDQEQRIFTL